MAGGDEAFEQARERNVPVLLSVGYAACHWCHVMAHESFEDPAIAQVMNDHFVNIKVDREERPDVDAVYMSATTALTGHGGWPMTVFLDHERRPFYAGTYFPPEPRSGMPSFRIVLEAISAAWEERATISRTLPSRSPPASTGRYRRFARSTTRSSIAPSRRCARPSTPDSGIRRGAEVPAADGARIPVAPPRPHR